MKITFIAVGKTTDKHVAALTDDYMGRIGHFNPFEFHAVNELRNTKSLSMEQQKEKEADLIMQQLKSGDHIILLDEKGREFRSIEFAEWLEDRLHKSCKRLIFIIGGPYGFDRRIYDMAQEKISLSKMTFSHQMIRVLFTEQLYRAFTIMKGMPYHHE